MKDKLKEFWVFSKPSCEAPKTEHHEALTMHACQVEQPDEYPDVLPGKWIKVREVIE
jgi:hypothetical protein